MQQRKPLLAGVLVLQKCKPRHLGPFSVGVYRVGQFRCLNCDAVLNGVEVYLDATEHASEGKQGDGEPWSDMDVRARPPASVSVKHG
jgi:hypothetical protein